MTYRITKMEVGEGEYRSKILYAKLVDSEGNLVISATLDYILLDAVQNNRDVENFASAFKQYIGFNEELRKR